MTLKALLFDFNGVIIKDESLHQNLIADLLLQENLLPDIAEIREISLGRSDRVCLLDLFHRRGRYISDEYLDRLIKIKTTRYLEYFEKIDNLPTYPHVQELLEIAKTHHLVIGLVTGALRSEVEYILGRLKLRSYFQVIVTGDEIESSKPDPEGYLLAVEKINQKYPSLNVKPQNCLAIEDTFAGIKACKIAHIPVVGVANTYPFHFLQRLANWSVDSLQDLEFDRIEKIFAQTC